MSGQTRARISALTKSRAPQLALVHSPVLVPANKTLAAAARRAHHSSSVLDPFERLHGRHAVARLVRALEPPRLKGTIWSPSSGLSAPQ